MINEWYYQDINGNKLGPFSLKELKQKYDYSHEITNQTKLISSDVEDWIECEVVFKLYAHKLEIGDDNNSIKTEDSFRFYKVGGWLLFFCITLVLIQPIMVLFSFFIIRSDSIIPSDLELYNIIDMILQIAITIYAIYVGIQLILLKPHAVKTAKIYLKVNLGFAGFYIILPYILGISNIYLDALLSLNLRNLIGTALYFSIWYSYLIKSVRVKLTYDVED